MTRDGQQRKNEQPTQRRLEKARKAGQFVSAKEFISALQFMVFLALLGKGGAHWLAQYRKPRAHSSGSPSVANCTPAT
jgi:flagellar biosynthesis protein FlhB